MSTKTHQQAPHGRHAGWTSVWVREATKRAFKAECKRRGLVLQNAADDALQEKLKEWRAQHN